MKITVKISQISLDEIFKYLGKHYTYIHDEATDALRHVTSQKDFDDVKSKIMNKYGDVYIVIDNEAPFWSDEVKIQDEAWEKDYNSFCERKAEFCEKYGSN